MCSLKKILLIVFVLICVGLLSAEDYIDLNFFIEPRFEIEDMNMVNFLIKNIQNDSIQQVNIFGGRILEKSATDSMIIEFLNAVQPDLTSPVDYLFSQEFIDFNLLASNIKSDSIPIIENQIFVTDSIKVGIFSIYTPDFSVKKDLPEYIDFGFEIPTVIEEQVQRLSKQADVVIMFSNLGKYIDADMMKKYEINAIVSFDYQKKRNELLSNRKTRWYSILTNKGKYGKLRITYANGKHTVSWQEIKFGLSETD